MKYIFIFSIIFISSTLIGQVKNVFLESRMDGSILLDGSFIFSTFWGYGIEGDENDPTKITLPGPVLTFTKGDSVNIRLINASPESHTIHWHGLDVDQANDGVGHTSHNVIPGDTFNYEFVCTHAGTYMYHCHVQTPLHLAMGMYGMFIVENDIQNTLYGTDTKYTKAYDFLFSEMNTNWNINPLSPGPFALYEADYLMVNGQSGGQLNLNRNKITGSINDTLAFRLANIGYGANHVSFPNNLNVVTVASDGREITHFNSAELTIYPGERFDVLAYPTEAFNGTLPIEYIDLRNNNLLGTNNIIIEIDDALNIETYEKNTPFDFFPNPTNEKLNIIINDKAENLNISIFDLTGKTMHTEQAVPGHTTVLNVENYKPGVYFIKAANQTQKFIKY